MAAWADYDRPFLLQVTQPRLLPYSQLFKQTLPFNKVPRVRTSPTPPTPAEAGPLACRLEESHSQSWETWRGQCTRPTWHCQATRPPRPLCTWAQLWPVCRAALGSRVPSGTQQCWVTWGSAAVLGREGCWPGLGRRPSSLEPTQAKLDGLDG